jgi:hypothetical protein
LVQTQATATSKVGDNILCLYAEQLPQSTSSASSDPTVTRTCVTANFQDQNDIQIKTPVDGVVPVVPTDFAPIICASKDCSQYKVCN